MQELQVEDHNYGVEEKIVGGVHAYWWPTMYGKTKGGKGWRFWMIGTDYTYHYTASGSMKVFPNGTVEFGKMVGPKQKLVVVPAGKVNTTQHAQAVEEIRSKINDKQRKGGFRARTSEGQTILFTYNSADNDVTFPHPEPMLAYVYDESTPLRGHWLAQLKLDGQRCLAMIHDGRLYLISRGNKEYTFECRTQHISQVIRAWLAQLPPGTIFDGEFYRHGLTANHIRSITARKNGDHPETAQVQYHVYDIITTNPQETYLQRYEKLIALSQWSGSQLQIERAGDGTLLSVEQVSAPENVSVHLVGFRTITSMESIAEFHAEATEKRNYEGLILREAAGIYDSKRSRSVLKYKEFEEEETTVVAVTEGEGQESKMAMFQVQDKFGVVYSVRPRGTHALRRLWYTQPQLVVGRSDYTVIHFKRSLEHGKMRFPVGKGFRNPGYW